MARQPSDRLLKRWLATGRPRRVEKLLAVDPAVAARLDRLTELDAAEVAALDEMVTPEEHFEARIIAGVHKRSDADASASLIVDLLGLGFRVGSALARPNQRCAPDQTDSDGPDSS